MKIVECVPNFSEGRDMAVIDAITAEISDTEGAVLLDVDPGANTNRTVVTMVGTPDAVVEAAFRAIKKAAELIDMSQHTGEHPRMGATDVCPFVPVSGVTMEECAELARKLGKRVGDELGISVYLYENAASRPERRNLADVRSGEYEGLPKKLKDPEWKPDFGPAEFNSGAGATAIGAREFLIAYNINLNTRDRDLVHDIAITIRERGRWQRDEDGKFVRDADGNKVRQDGMFQHCKAIGWYIDEYRRAQISINFTNYKVTPPHLVFEAVRKLAAEKGLRVTGCELVGLIPKAAMLEAGHYFLKQQGKSTGVPERELIEIAAISLGLSEVSPFNADDKIVEYRVEKVGNLVGRSVVDLVDEISIDSPVPGGGSVAALCGALGSALASMVANLTHGKNDYKGVWDEVVEIAEKAQALKDFFVKAVDRDSEAFDAVMTAMRLPKKSDEEKAARGAAIEEAGKGAVMVPMEVLRKAPEALELAGRIAEIGNVNSVSDAGVAAQCILTCAIGASYNVLINLPGLEDSEYKKDAAEEAAGIRAKVELMAAKVDKTVLSKIG
ncbi:MAG TPA: glutamate formimidoyltransferase [Acidobacteriota bacterium]|nr:glutamate formimidoyltransferase [Acidobacteriota bacterium]